MNNDFAELILTIDTREKGIERINSIQNYFELRGAYVEKKSLKRCDYWIDGNYKDVSVNLGIEYKTMEDFAGSFQDLSWKLAESYDTYSDVALFVETGNYDLIDVDNGTLVRNYKIKDVVGTLRYDVFQNLIRSFAIDGIYTQTFINVFEFPRSVHNLLNYIVKPTHKGVQYKTEDAKSILKNMIMQIPGIGVHKANQCIEKFPTMYDMCLLSVDNHQEALGKITGNRVHDLLREGEWKT